MCLDRSEPWSMSCRRREGNVVTRPTRADAAGRAYLDLQNLARRQGRQTQTLMVIYVLERFLAHGFRAGLVPADPPVGAVMTKCPRAFSSEAASANADTRAIARSLS